MPHHQIPFSVGARSHLSWGGGHTRAAWRQRPDRPALPTANPSLRLHWDDFLEGGFSLPPRLNNWHQQKAELFLLVIHRLFPLEKLG